MKVTKQLVRSGEGYVSHVGGRATACVDASGGTTIGRSEQLRDEPVSPHFGAAIERIRACLSKADP